MAEYAKGTEVSAEKSRGEIERTLARYGADSFMYGWTPEGAIIAFRCNGRHVKFVVPMPNRNSREFTHVNRGRVVDSWQERSPEAAEKLWEQATRQRWRALALVIKAKLEAVEAEISTFEAEFLSNTLLPDGQTVAEWIEPQIEKAYTKGVMPTEMKLALPPAGGTS
jgi:hypothetical protein